MKRLCSRIIYLAIVVSISADMWAAQKNVGRPVSMSGRALSKRLGIADPEQEEFVRQLQEQWQAALALQRAVKDQQEQFPFEWKAIQEKIDNLETLRGLVKAKQKLLTAETMERVGELVKEIHGLQANVQAGHAPMQEFEQEEAINWDSDIEEVDVVDQQGLVVPGPDKGLRGDEARRAMERVRREQGQAVVQEPVSEQERRDVEQALAASLEDQARGQEESKEASGKHYKREQTKRSSEDANSDPLMGLLSEYGLPNSVGNLVKEYKRDSWIGYDPQIKQIDFVENVGRIRSLFGPSPVRAVGITADEKFIITVSADRVCRIWDVKTEKLHEKRSLSSARKVFFQCAINQGATVVGIQTADNVVQLSDIKTGALIQTFSAPLGINRIAISADATFVLTGCVSHVTQLWDVATGVIRHSLMGSGGIFALAVSPDDERVIIGYGNHIARIWSVATGEEIAALSSHTNVVSAVAISADNTFVVTGSWDRTVCIWDFATKEIRHRIDCYERIMDVAISSDDRLIVVGTQKGFVYVIDAQTGQFLHTFFGDNNKSNILSVGISPGDSFIVSGSLDGVTRMWRLLDPEPALIKPIKKSKKTDFDEHHNQLNQQLLDIFRLADQLLSDKEKAEVVEKFKNLVAQGADLNAMMPSASGAKAPLWQVAHYRLGTEHQIVFYITVKRFIKLAEYLLHESSLNRGEFSEQQKAELNDAVRLLHRIAEQKKISKQDMYDAQHITETAAQLYKNVRQKGVIIVPGILGKPDKNF